MVANYSTGNGFKGALSYSLQEKKGVEEKKKCELVAQYGVRGDSSQVAKQMRYQSSERERVQKPCLHLSVSFPKEDKDLTPEQEIKAVQSTLKEVGITPKTHQMQIVRHNDTDNRHYHIVVNRVDNFGQLHNDHRLKDRLQVACSKTEREMKLHSHDKQRTCIYAPEEEKGFKYQNNNKREKNPIKAIQQPNDKKTGVKEHRAEVQKKVLKSLDDCKSKEEFIQNCKKQGLDVQTQERNGKLTGVSFKDEKGAVKGSQIGVKAKDIEKAIEKKIEYPSVGTAEFKAKQPERATAPPMEKQEQSQKAFKDLEQVKAPPTQKTAQEQPERATAPPIQKEKTAYLAQPKSQEETKVKTAQEHTTEPKPQEEKKTTFVKEEQKPERAGQNFANSDPTRIEPKQQEQATAPPMEEAQAKQQEQQQKVENIQDKMQRLKELNKEKIKQSKNKNKGFRL